jgi:exopolysaccharide biosynthesis polyprenyl glycosylphosphotransferase
VFSRQDRKSRPLFAVSDIFLIWAAFEAAYLVRSFLPLPRLFYLEPSIKFTLLLVSALAFVVIALWLRAYDGLSSISPLDLAVRTSLQCLWGGVSVVLIQFALRLDLSRPFLGLFLLFSFLSLLLFRLLFRAAAPALAAGLAQPRQVLIGGDGPRARQVAETVAASRPQGLQLIGFLSDQPGQIHLGRTYPVHPWRELPVLLERHVIDEFIVAVDSAKLAEIEDLLLLCDDEGVRTRLDIGFFPHVHSRVSLERLGSSQLLTFAGAPHDEFRLTVKRFTDFLLALTAIFLASPFLLAIALAIRLGSPGPVLFAQQRCGLNGRRFKLYKFRTMVVNAEQLKDSLAHLNIKKTAFKIPNDPRVTRVGHWLRKFSLDELPQLFNILKGEMAIVGPRPPVPSEVAEYERWQRRRLRMRPGLTCLWTLAGRDALDFEEWMKLDLAYIDTWSLRLDWIIMLRTVPYVLSGKGAH